MNHTAETTTDHPGLPPEDDLGVELSEQSLLKDSDETSEILYYIYCINQAKLWSIFTFAAGQIKPV